MARRKRVTVWRQHGGPAVRFDIARSLPVAGFLQGAEEKYSSDRCRTCRADRREAVRASVEVKNDSQRVPQPAVAAAGGKDHQNAEPARRAPAVNAAHQPVVAGLDLVPQSFTDGHVDSPIAIPAACKTGCGKAVRRRGRASCGASTWAAHLRLNRRSSRQVYSVMAGIRTARGESAMVHAFSRIISRAITRTSRVSLRNPPDSP